MAEIHSNNKIDDAMEFAKQKHSFQLRKDGRTLYWVHLEQVVNNLISIGIKDEDLLCAGWLHDTIEDTNTDFDDIHEKFGLHVAEVVSQVTKGKRLSKMDREQQYIKNLQGVSWQAQAIKLCDILANLSDLSNSPQSPAEKDEQVSNKLRYLEAVKDGLIANRNKFPNLGYAIDRINLILAEYNKRTVSF